MDGFTKVHNEVVFDRSLSLGARVAHAALKHLAWRAGRRRAEDGVLLPPLDEVADALGCSRTALKGYLKELRDVGLVVTVRRQHRAMTYFVYDDPTRSDSALAERRTRAESDPDLGRKTPPRTRVDAGTAKDNGNGDANASPPAPPLTKLAVAGEAHPQDVALNALCEALGIDRRGPRVGQAAAAMNRRAGKPGIRDLFWLECRAQAEARGLADELGLLAAGGEQFERMLEERVRRKVALLRAAQPWRSTIAPSTVRDFWLDVENAAPAGAGLTPAEIERVEV